jgi:hypothetical protein
MPSFNKIILDGIDLASLVVCTGNISSETEVPMSAQIIQLSDHRKVRPPRLPGLMSLSFAIFGAYLVVGAAINEAIIEAAKISLKNET